MMKKTIRDIKQELANFSVPQTPADRWNPLCLACIRGDFLTVERLIEAGADVNIQDKASGWTPLEAALNYYGRRDEDLLYVEDTALPIVELLVENGADVNFTSFYRLNSLSWTTTPLYTAVFRGDKFYYVIQFLLDAGADPNSMGRNNETALIHAASVGYSPRIVGLLIEAGASLDRKESEEGDTALIKAVKKAATSGRDQVVQLLIAGGADVNAQNKKRLTALHIAVAVGSLDLVKLLIDSGADPTIRSRIGTPLAIAEKQCHTKIASYLRMVTADKKRR